MKEDTPSPPEKDTIDRGHEIDAVNSRLMIISGLALAALMGISIALAYGLISARGREAADRFERPRSAEQPQETGGVRFTADQPQQLEELREVEKQKLHDYEWIDKSEGIARIPIDRAMDILATNGLPKNMPKSENDDANTQPK